jgi:hypothetical protein
MLKTALCPLGGQRQKASSYVKIILYPTSLFLILNVSIAEYPAKLVENTAARPYVW